MVESYLSTGTGMTHNRSTMLKRTILMLLVFVATLYAVEACNSAICGPRVTKCMLINCCDCDMSDKNNCSCCVECALCLTKLYTECCSCVGLCPVRDPNESQAKTSTIEDLTDPIPGLFNALTEQEDVFQRWTTFTYGIDLDKLVAGQSMPDDNVKIVRADHSFKKTLASPLVDSTEPVLGIRNCTVAFFSECLSLSKCKDSCASMGAAKYRWFHEHGCCQCVGSSCHTYGLSQPHCLQCPEQEDNLYTDPLANPSHSHRRHKHLDQGMDSF